MYGGFHNKFGMVVRPSGLYNGHSHAQDFYRHDPVIPVEKYLDLLKNIQDNNKGLKLYSDFEEAGISVMDKSLHPTEYSGKQLAIPV